MEPEYDDTERRRVAHSEVRARAREIDRKNALAFVLSDRNGRKAIWDLLSRCGVFSASFDREPVVMAMKEGQRVVGLWLLAQLETEYPGAYALMQREHSEREQRYAAIPEPELEEDDE